MEKKLTRTVERHTNHGESACVECGKGTGWGTSGFINHYLEHGYELLHLGSEWGNDQEGKSVSHTIVVMGKY